MPAAAMDADIGSFSGQVALRIRASQGIGRAIATAVTNEQPRDALLNTSRV